MTHEIVSQSFISINNRLGLSESTKPGIAKTSQWQGYGLSVADSKPLPKSLQSASDVRTVDNTTLKDGSYKIAAPPRGTGDQIMDTIESEHIGRVKFRYIQDKDSTVGGAGSKGVCLGMSYGFLKALMRADSSKPVFVKDATKPSPVDLGPNERTGERQASPQVRFAQAMADIVGKFRHSVDETMPLLSPLLKRDGITEKEVGAGTLFGDKELDGGFLAEVLTDTFKKQFAAHSGNDRCLSILTLCGKNGGHAIAIDARSNGAVQLLDPNLGLLLFDNWGNFEKGIETIWDGYANKAYTGWTLKEYTKAVG